MVVDKEEGRRRSRRRRRRRRSGRDTESKTRTPHKDVGNNKVMIMTHGYLRAAAPAADPGRIGKEAKQIGIKTLRCFAP